MVSNCVTPFVVLFLGGVEHHEVDIVGVIHAAQVEQSVDAFTLRLKWNGLVATLKEMQM